MIVLDTNVLSEAMKPLPSPQVMRWLRSQPALDLFVTAITLGEIFAGIELLASGKRRSAIEKAAEATFATDFDGHILPFDSEAAREFARIVADRRRLGRPISQPDAQIAAIARSRGAAIATRNAADFENCGIAVLNPWA